MAVDSPSREAIEAAFEQLPFDAQCIIRLKPNFVFINDPLRGMGGAYSINAKISDVISSIRNKYNCHVEIFNAQMVPVPSEAYLLDHLCCSENTIYVRLRNPTPEFPLSAEPFQLEHHPLPLAHIPSSALHMDTDDFLREVNSRLQARNLPARASLLNERGEPARPCTGPVVSWLMQSNSHFLYLRPQPIVGLDMRHTNAQPGSSFGAVPTTSHLGAIPTPSSSQHAPHPQQTMSITLKDGVVLNLDPTQYSVGQGKFMPEESAIQSLREFVGLHTPPEEQLSLFTSSEIRYWPESWRSAHSEFVRVLRDLLGKTKSPNSMSREDVIGMAAYQSLRLTYGLDIRTMTGLLDTNNALTRRVRQLETQLGTRGGSGGAGAGAGGLGGGAGAGIAVGAGGLGLNAAAGGLGLLRNAAYNLWRSIRTNFLSVIMIIFQLVRLEVVQNAVYIMLWAFIINSLGRGSWKVSAVVFLLCAINFLVHILKHEYRLEFADLVITHCLPNIYPSNAATLVDKERIHIAAELDLAGEDWDMNEFLDSVIRRPTIFEFVSVSIFSVVPSVLIKWQGSVDEKRLKLRGAIKELVEAEKAKISGKVGNEEGRSTAISTTAGITNVNSNQ